MKRLSLVILLLSSIGIGCKFFDTLKGGSPSGTGGGSAAASGDPKADVIAASQKFIGLKSFSAKTEGVGQTDIKSQIDYVAPDRYHITYLAGTGSGMEMIIVGNQSYLKPAGGSWSKMQGDAKSIPSLRDSFTEEGLKSLSDVKSEGEDTVNGRPALVYSYMNVTPVGRFPFSCKIWIAKDTGLPMKVYVEYSNGVLRHMTVSYDTESPVSIEAPIE